MRYTTGGGIQFIGQRTEYKSLSKVRRSVLTVADTPSIRNAFAGIGHNQPTRKRLGIRVADAIAVGIIGIVVGARITAIGHPVTVSVKGIVKTRTRVIRIAQTVPVRVVQRIQRTRVTAVRHAIAIAVLAHTHPLSLSHGPSPISLAPTIPPTRRTEPHRRHT